MSVPAGRLAVAATETVSGLDAAATLVEIVGGVVTTIAVIVGAFWAYFKFVKGRTFRPRVAIATSCGWVVDDAPLLRFAVSVTNIGNGRVVLLQRGTGAMLSRVQSSDEPGEITWERAVPIVAVFEKHAWIEPGETVTDELLVRMPERAPVIEAQIRLVFEWKPQNIVVHARRVLQPSTTRSASAQQTIAHQGGDIDGVETAA